MYVIVKYGWFLTSRPGWGPRFAPELDNARRFGTISEAYEYRRNNLGGMRCDIGRVDMWGNVSPVASK